MRLQVRLGGLGGTLFRALSNILPVLLVAASAGASPVVQIVKTHMTGEMNSLRAVARGLGGTVVEVDAPMAGADYVIHALASEIDGLVAFKRTHPSVRLINLGDPLTHRSAFDLILTSRVLPHAVASNVVAVEGIPAQTALPAEREAGLVAVMIGGLDSASALSLARELSHARRAGDRYTITRSRRTPDDVWDLFRREMAWTSEDTIFSADYAKVLGRAERFVVTGDSMSMIADALKTGKPTFVAEAPLEPQHRAFIREQVEARRLRLLSNGFASYRYSPLDTAREMSRRILLIGSCESLF